MFNLSRDFLIFLSVCVYYNLYGSDSFKMRGYGITICQTKKYDNYVPLCPFNLNENNFV